MLHGLISLIKDYIFPVYCLGCQTEGEWVCKNCYNNINAQSVFCFTNLEDNFVNLLISPYLYQENELIGKIIQYFKYHYAEELEQVIFNLINKFLLENKNLFAEIDCVIPVPLHARRLAERGFNQAEVIAKILGAILNKPVLNNLGRVRYTKQQAKLNKLARQENVASAFVVNGKISNNILIVDDVFTTGATTKECAKVLKQAGAKKIIAFTLARG
ncbi:MAG: hypothetical protein US42_C0003G0056 [Candidatus Magasanikbacteria bacterium GW2011_GWC2_37_14]|uniref:Phosphoribosyltransferase domain-containing protein n=1 Tax=Candidatus Magasanikbacteria bacterium GW2011_GWC2_37_14 TaxID=1619046 RepID=A0A0G0IV04_9BACT|nr:MAG: hypothetical protein US42_C0003G0056 [Candidatus Magasanikbacteria bacterium GW2011_GWC2_37_14]